MKKLEKEVYGVFEGIMQDFGLDTLSGRIFVALFLAPGEIALEEIAKKTGYSLSSVSTKMRFFEQTDLVKRKRKPGSKKVYFLMDMDVTELTRHKIQLSLDREIKPLKKQIPEIIKRHKPVSNQSTDVSQRIQTLEKMMKDVKHVEAVLKKTLDEL
ncbi:MAG: GbsR/MarR family transcriptional regulator [Candidatus Woesearchaeota archaeon]